MLRECYIGAMKRYFFPDFLRGVAVTGMVVFHFFYIVDFLGWLRLELYDGWWLVLARGVQFLFLGLVGFLIAMSYGKGPEGFYRRQWRRLLKIGLAALTVSLVTYFFINHVYVRQGVLHFIFLASVVILPFVGKRWWLVAIAVLGLVGGEVVQRVDFSFPFIAYVLGFENVGVPSVDYFPLFPWITVVSVGALLGNIGLPYLGRIESFMAGVGSSAIGRGLQFIGRNALLIYLTHVPLIILILLLYWWCKDVLIFAL